MRKIFTLISVFVAITAVAQSHREVTLSDNWQFSRDKVNWQEVTVPHDWAIDGPFDKLVEDGYAAINCALGSWHVSGCNVLFADGSVRYFDQNVAYETVAKLATVDDGNYVEY